MHTNLANLTNDELIREIETVRRFSPVIDELAKRIEDGELAGDTTNHSVECPVCRAALTADYEPGNDMFTLETKDA